MFRSYLNLPRAVYLLCLGTLVNRVGTLIIPFLTLYVREHLGLSTTVATQAMGCYGCGAIAGSLLGGHLADRIGRRPVMLAALLGGGALLLAYSALRTAPALLAVTFLLAFVADLYRPAASAMLADLVPPDRRPHAFTLMYVAINLGFAVSPVIGGLLAEISFQWLFIADAATSWLYGLLILFVIRETPPARAWQSAAGPEPGALPTAGAASPRSAHPDSDWRQAAAHILHNRSFLLFCLASFLTAVVYVQALSTFPLFLDGLGIRSVQYGQIIATNGVLIVFGQIPMTAWVTRFDRGRVLAAASALVALGFGLNALAARPWQFALLVVVWTMGEMLQAPLFGPIISDLAPSTMRARYMSVGSVCYQGANMLGAPLGGLVLAYAGGGYIWGTSTIVAGLAGVLYLAIRRRIAARVQPD